MKKAALITCLFIKDYWNSGARLPYKRVYQSISAVAAERNAFE